jgi:hypothetical protein
MRKTPSLISEIIEKSKKDPWYKRMKRRITLRLFIFVRSIEWKFRYCKAK